MWRLSWHASAIVVSCAVSMLAAAMALAGESPEILPNPTAAAPVSFTAKSGHWAVNDSSVSISGTTTMSSGEFTSTRLGKGNTDLLEASLEPGVPCKTTGDEKGTILFASDEHLVAILAGSVLSLGLAVTPAATVLFRCGTLSFEIKGTAIGQFDNLTSGTSVPAGTVKTVLFHATRIGGSVQVLQTCGWDKAFCEGRTIFLLMETGIGFHEAALEAEDEISFGRTLAVDF